MPIIREIPSGSFCRLVRTSSHDPNALELEITGDNLIPSDLLPVTYSSTS